MFRLVISTCWSSTGFYFRTITFSYIHKRSSWPLKSTAELFADGTSLLSTVYEPNISASQLDSELKKNSHWAYKWKVTFNLDLSKQAQEVIFYRKTVKISHPSVTFNTVQVARATCQKHIYSGRWQHVSMNFYVRAF